MKAILHCGIIVERRNSERDIVILVPATEKAGEALARAGDCLSVSSGFVAGINATEQ